MTFSGIDDDSPDPSLALRARAEHGLERFLARWEAHEDSGAGDVAERTER